LSGGTKFIWSYQEDIQLLFRAYSTLGYPTPTHHRPITVKPISDARWESKIDALKSLRYHVDRSYDALVQISEKKIQKGKAFHKRVDAKGLALNIYRFSFVVLLCFQHKILFEINNTSKLLQEKSTHLKFAIQQLGKTKKYLCGLRNEEGALTDATTLARPSDLEIEPNFQSSAVTNRKKETHFNNEAEFDNLEDPNENFRVNAYYVTLDMAISSTEKRFQQL